MGFRMGKRYFPTHLVYRGRGTPYITPYFFKGGGRDTCRRALYLAQMDTKETTLENERAEQITKTCQNLAKLLIAKNRDYGDSAFKSPPLAPCLSATAAILVRMGDKIERLETLARKLANDDEIAVASETIEDTIADLAGYCVLLLIAMKERRASSKGGEE